MITSLIANKPGYVSSNNRVLSSKKSSLTKVQRDKALAKASIIIDKVFPAIDKRFVQENFLLSSRNNRVYIGLKIGNKQIPFLEVEVLGSSYTIKRRVPATLKGIDNFFHPIYARSRVKNYRGKKNAPLLIHEMPLFVGCDFQKELSSNELLRLIKDYGNSNRTDVVKRQRAYNAYITLCQRLASA